MNALAFFGAFNPPTVAHLTLPRAAMAETGAETVIYVPSQQRYISDHQGKDLALSDDMRLRMLRAAAETRPWMRVCDWELDQPEQPRTWMTLSHLRDEGFEPALLIGSDKLTELPRWRRVDLIAREFGIVCLARGEDDCQSVISADPDLSALGIRVVATPDMTKGVSSTKARALCAAGAGDEAFEGLVTSEVLSILRGALAENHSFLEATNNEA